MLSPKDATDAAMHSLDSELKKYAQASGGGATNPLDTEVDCEDEADTLVNEIKFDNDRMNHEIEPEDFDNKPLSHVSPVEAADGPETKRQKTDLDTFKERLNEASAYIIVPPTRKEYARQWDKFVTFCKESGFIKDTQSFEAACRAGNIPGDTPVWIAVWIMQKCDKINIETGEKEHLRSVPKYGTAQKMRAALSHRFGRDFGRGEQNWCESQVFPGTFIGNPSLSQVVGNYMSSLRRVKVKEGEVAVSARAITAELIRSLWEYNSSDNSDIPDDEAPDASPIKRARGETWLAGRSFRRMLHLVYVLSFLCLLRFDEALRIQWPWIEFDRERTKNSTWLVVKLSLPYRKTHQTGEIAPFYLYPNDVAPWLCPVKAFSEWMNSVTAEDMHGFLFRKKIHATWSRDPDAGLSAESFLACFRSNLLDIKQDPRPFGTHSFRRGGCQYLAMTLRWPFRDVCTWGGWAENYDSPGTVFKYLLSYVDAPTVERHDYFNPQRKTVNLCTVCGRSCWCS